MRLGAWGRFLDGARTGEVDDEEIDDELSDLHRGEVLLPLRDTNKQTVSYAFQKFSLSRLRGEHLLTQILAPPAVA